MIRRLGNVMGHDSIRSNAEGKLKTVSRPAGTPHGATKKRWHAAGREAMMDGGELGGYDGCGRNVCMWEWHNMEKPIQLAASPYHPHERWDQSSPPRCIWKRGKVFDSSDGQIATVV